MRVGHKVGILVFVGLGMFTILGGCASKPQQPMVGERVGNFMDDSYLTSAIKTKLLGDAGLKSFHVHVSTQSRVVTLSGVLPSDALRDRAIQIAKSVDGVVKVVSNLEVKAE